MAHLVSVVLHSLSILDSSLGGFELHGANLAMQLELRHLMNHPRIEAIEVFIEPREMVNVPVLERVAIACLSPENRGKGRLRFYPITSLPKVLDDQPRIFYSLDPDNLVRDRYLRDRFAKGPMPIVCDTHSLGQYHTFFALNWLRRVDPAPGDTIASLSPALSEALRKSFEPQAPFRIVEWHRGVDLKQFHPVSNSKLARERLKLPLDGTCFLYFGRLTPNSKADLLPLIEAFSEAATPDCFLLIAGIENVPGYGAHLQRYADQLGARVIVRAQPVSPGESPHYYQAADVFCFPGDTIQEALGNTYLEAMASGLPIITSDWVAGPVVVQHNENGVVIPCYWTHPLTHIEALSPALEFTTNYLALAQSVWMDARKLQEAIQNYAVNPELRERHGRASRVFAEAKYDMEDRINALIDIFDKAQKEASLETLSGREARRNEACELGLPIPFRRIFSHYATGTLGDDTVLELTAHGRRAQAGVDRVHFYDETLPMIDLQLMQVLLTALPKGPITLRNLVAKALTETDFDEDSVRCHVGLLLKRSVLSATPVHTESDQNGL